MTFRNLSFNLLISMLFLISLSVFSYSKNSNQMFSRKLKGVRRTTGVLGQFQTTNVLQCMLTCIKSGECVGVNVIMNPSERSTNLVNCELTRGSTEVTKYSSNSNSSYYERPCDIFLSGSVPCPSGLTCCYDLETGCAVGDLRPQCKGCAQNQRNTGCHQTCSAMAYPDMDIAYSDTIGNLNNADIGECFDWCWKNTDQNCVTIIHRYYGPDSGYQCWFKNENEQTSEMFNPGFTEVMYTFHCN